MSSFRVGFGYDTHRLIEGRALILGGIKIPHSKGLLGHSDADCLTHAIADALLGAAGLPDIGHFFPDTDLSYKDINSQEILKKVIKELKNLGFELVNIDTTLLAEKPKLSPYMPSMKAQLAKSLEIDISQIGIKATTTEKTGPIGAEEALSAYAVCLIEKKIS